MAELVELNSSEHNSLKIAENCSAKMASRLHVMNLRVVEIGKASSCFPLFITRNSITGSWELSAITSFEQGHNLFVENEQWTALYQPTGMQTYPFYLMRSPNDENGYTVGIDEQSEAFSEEHGEALFDRGGQASPYLRKVTALLEADINNDIQTYHFAKRLEELDLIKSIDIPIHYDDGAIQTLKGLHTLNEDKLQSLQAGQLEELNKKGYLAPIHAMLISIYQLNSLIQKHNKSGRFTNVKQIKLEVTKNTTAA